MALGCWVTLLVLAFDTFVQQIVQFVPNIQYRNTVTNVIPFATDWDGGQAVGVSLPVSITGKEIIASEICCQ